MKAKDYLRHLNILEICIDQKVQELSNLRNRRTDISVKYTERVQTSMSDKTGDMIAQCVYLQNEINSEIDKLYNLKHKAINEIQMLKNEKHIEILFKRYIEFKNFEEISVDMNLAYTYVLQIHGSALREFEKAHEIMLKT